MTSPSWNWYVCKTSNLSRIADITNNAHSKKLQLMLNKGGTGTCWFHIEDKKTIYIEEHKTSIVTYRDNKAVWSGEIFDCEENIDNQNNFVLSVTALGWFEILNRRKVHTGYEWKEMAIKASGRSIKIYPSEEHEKELEEIQKQYEEVIAEKFYIPVATESAEQLFYSNVPMAEIANDLIIRANIDSPTLITVGDIAPTNSINITIQQFQNVGEEITKLTAIESGFDFEIDPLTRKFNTYREEIKGGIAGKGVDRGSGIRFTYPGNCVLANRKSEGTKTQNRTEAIGQYGVGKSEGVQSREENGLFEGTVNAPEVTNTNILIALATVETLTLEQPFKIVTFNPRVVNNSESFSVPRPYIDYEIGDIVYTVINKGPRFKIGLKNPQPVRIYGFTIAPEDSGVERVTGIQTVYSQ